MDKQKIFNLLTICRKAGKMNYGAETCKGLIKSNTAKLVMLASDLSPKSAKDISFFCEKAGINVINTDITIDEFDYGTGKKTGIIAVCDEGFAKRLNELLTAQDAE